MNINAKVTNTVDQCGSVYVSNCESGEIAVSFGTAEGKSVRRFLDPARAVALWRCLTGETEKADIATTYAETMRIFYDDKTTLWKIVLQPDLVAILNADQAMALAWSLKRCVAKALDATPRPAPKLADKIEMVFKSVWALSAIIVMTGDAAADGSELVGGAVKVFSSKEKAEDALREFMRPLVNDANTEDHWASAEENVDDVLDDIIDKREQLPGDAYVASFKYDGSKQAFKVVLAELNVDGVA